LTGRGDRSVAASDPSLGASDAARAALGRSEQRYRSLAEVVPVQVWTARPNGQLDFVSERSALYFGVPVERLLGSGWGEFVHPDDVGEALGRWAQALSTGDPYTAEFRLLSGDGEYRWHLARAVASRDENGAVSGWVGCNTDVESERRARAEAEAANRAKSEFLANMSHELRTPLNAVTGYADLLELGIGGPLTEVQVGHVARIKASTAHLVGLIDEVLDLSRVEAGQLLVEPERTQVSATVLEALDLLGPTGEESVAIDNAIPPDDEAAYWGDSYRVRQVLVNLLSNAVKFTPAGGRIVVSCTSESRQPPHVRLPGVGPWLAIHVTDTGIGIAAEQQQAVFEPFVQVDPSHTRERGGTGLGLAISRQMARLMNGDVTLRSEPGRGSRFTLWLPAEAAASSPHAEQRTGSTLSFENPCLVEVGDALAEGANAIVDELVLRMRGDPLFPGAATLERAQLEDHIATFIVNIGLALVALGDGGSQPAMLDDGATIQGTISRLHGAQRARLGWPASTIGREFALLGEITAEALRRKLPHLPTTTLEESIAVVLRLLDQAERVSTRGWNRAAAGSS
jgi:PAS domain S-box-containing protein